MEGTLAALAGDSHRPSLPTQAQQSFPALPAKPLADQGSKVGETWKVQVKVLLKGCRKQGRKLGWINGDPDSLGYITHLRKKIGILGLWNPNF